MKYIIIAVGAFMLASSAQANRSCPDGTVEMNGQCVVVDNGGGSNPGNVTANGGAGGSAEASAAAIAAAQGGAGGQGGYGGAGGQGGAGGNAAQDQKQGQQQGQTQSSRSTSNANNHNNVRTGNQTTNVDASSDYREAANAVYAGQATYTGNPCAIGGGVGGSSIGQTFGGNLTVLDKACANKQHDLAIIDRTCAYLTVAECRATIAYLEPQARAGMVAAGTIRERAPGETVSVSRHEQGDGSFTKAMNKASKKTSSVTRSVTCPAGSQWDGKGCWAANLKAVRR